MRTVLYFVLLFAFGVSLSAREKTILVNGVPVKIKETEDNAEKAQRLELVEWLKNLESKAKKGKENQDVAYGICTDVKERAFKHRYDKKVSAAAVKSISPLLWSKKVDIQMQSVELIAVFQGNARALQYLSRLCTTLRRKSITMEKLQIAVVKAIAEVAPTNDQAGKVLLNVLKNDYEASDNLRVETINAMSRIKCMGTVKALLEALLVLSPDPALCGTSGDFMKNKKWQKYKAPLYGALKEVLQIDDPMLPYSDLKKWIEKNNKGLKVRFAKAKKELADKINPPKEKKKK